MRACEFITEQREDLPAEIAKPLKHAFIIPGIRNNDAYHTYRLGTAIARARAEVGGEDLNFPEFEAQSSFGQNAVIVGFNNNVDQVIDKALKMTGTKGGKIGVGSTESEEPVSVETTSPIKAFKGYK